MWGEQGRFPVRALVAFPVREDGDDPETVQTLNLPVSLPGPTAQAETAAQAPVPQAKSDAGTPSSTGDPAPDATLKAAPKADTATAPQANAQPAQNPNR